MNALRTLVSVILFLPVLTSAESLPSPQLPSSGVLEMDLSSPGVKRLQDRLENFIASKVDGVGAPGWHGTGLVALAEWGGPGRELMVAALADTTKPEKKRIEKTEKKKKGASEKAKEEGSTSSCFGDCLGGFFGSMLSSDDDKTSEVIPAGYAQMPEMETGLFSVPYDAVIRPRNPQAGGVSVWDNPGGRDLEAAIVASIAGGEEVTVTATDAVGTSLWLRIVTRGTPATVGWIDENDVIKTAVVGAEPAPLPEAPPIEEEPYFDVTQQRWEILFDLGVPVFTEGQINDEYSKKMFTIGLATRLFMLHSFQVNGGASYIHSNGEPKFDFTVGTTTESPSDSRLNILSFGVGLGQLYQIFGPKGFVLWQASPSVFYVRESADITVSQNKVVTDTRTDKRSEWRGGLQAKLEIGAMADTFPISGYVTYAIFPWQSNNERSLTFDFLEKTRVVIFGFGITIGASFF